MTNIAPNQLSQSRWGLRFPTASAMLTGAIATISLAAIGRKSDSLIEHSIEPKISWGAIDDRRTDQGVNRTQRTGPWWENWGRFDWVHEFHHYEMNRWAPVIYTFNLPRGGSSLTVTGKMFRQNRQRFETDIAWKEVGLLFGGMAVQEKGQRSYPLAPAEQFNAQAVATAYWKKHLRLPVTTLLKTARRIAQDGDLRPHDIEIEVKNGKLVRADLILDNKLVDIQKQLAENVVVKATLAKSAESWSATLSF